jgi:ribose 5-phosphate isomerase B
MTSAPPPAKPSEMNFANTREVHIASDHAGFDLKEQIKKALPHISWVDHGPVDASRVDYPDFADLVAKAVKSKPEACGLLLCGSGQGMAMRANRHNGVRAALAWNEDSARLSREHNNANVLCLGARLIPMELALKLIEVFLSTSFAGGRHLDRVAKIESATED